MSEWYKDNALTLSTHGLASRTNDQICLIGRHTLTNKVNESSSESVGARTACPTVRAGPDKIMSMIG